MAGKVASEEGEAYIVPCEIDFKFGILKKDKINTFTNRPK